MLSLKKHHNKREQNKKYKEHISNLKGGKFVIHVDYSENYKNKQQREIKSAFYGQGQFTIFTACIYKMENHLIVCSNYALITPENDHSCNISFGLNNFLIEQISKEKDVMKVIFWSDGCASQFRSQYALYMLTKFDTGIDIQWHYFEADQGKGAVDGIGGRVKHSVFRVKSHQVIIQSPVHFAKYANSILPGINVIFVANHDMKLGFHDECGVKAVYIPGTLKINFVDRVIKDSQCKLKFYECSAENKPLRTQEYTVDALTKVGSYYIVEYEGGLFPGIVEAVNSNKTFRAKCMVKAFLCTQKSAWEWPATPDIHDYPIEDVKQQIVVPKVLPGRCRNITFAFPELEHIWGQGFDSQWSK